MLRGTKTRGNKGEKNRQSGDWRLVTQLVRNRTIGFLKPVPLRRHTLRQAPKCFLAMIKLAFIRPLSQKNRFVRHYLAPGRLRHASTVTQRVHLRPLPSAADPLPAPVSIRDAPSRMPAVVQQQIRSAPPPAIARNSRIQFFRIRPPQSDSSRIQSHSRSQAPAQLARNPQRRWPPRAKRRPEKTARNSGQILQHSPRQSASSCRTRPPPAPSKLRMAHRVMPSRWPRRGHRRAMISGPLPYKVADREEGRAHAVPRQHVQQLRRRCIVRPVVERQRNLARMSPAISVRPKICDVGHPRRIHQPARNETQPRSAHPAPAITPGTLLLPAGLQHRKTTSSACPCGVTSRTRAAALAFPRIRADQVGRGVPLRSPALPYIILSFSRP